jgi:indole-3-glycerol phosphate synthase
LPETQASHGASGILDRIVETKKAEVSLLRSRRREFEDRLPDAPPARDLAKALARPGEVALMAEVKRRSPGAGPIRPDLVPADLATAYESSGASAISVLTDRDYFGGGIDDLTSVRGAVGIPVFRKDFIIDEVQILEARAAGADGMLLIARILDGQTLGRLHRFAVDVGLTPLVEVHGQEEVDKALAGGARIIGINNRNLQTFQTSLSVTLDLFPSIPEDVVVISESGIRTAAEVDRLGSAGVHGILVGETILRADDPGVAVKQLAGRPRAGR